LHDQRSAVRPDRSTIDDLLGRGRGLVVAQLMRAIALRRSDLIGIGVGTIRVFAPTAAHLVGGGES